MLASNDKTDERFKPPSSNSQSGNEKRIHRSKLDTLDKEASKLKQELVDLKNADLVETKNNLGNF